jgi:hypothetical protein
LAHVLRLLALDLVFRHVALRDLGRQDRLQVEDLRVKENELRGDYLKFVLT